MKPILVYDINVLPYGMEADKMTYMFKEHGVVFYDGTTSRSKHVPIVYSTDTNIVKLIDTKLLKAVELKELIKGIEDMYYKPLMESLPVTVEEAYSPYDQEYCNYDGKIVNKYVYYVRKIKGIPAITVLTSLWLKEFEEYKLTEEAYFPRLSLAQIANLDEESQAKLCHA